MIDIFKVFKELESVKGEAVRLIEEIHKAEEEKERLLKKLWEMEDKCLKLKEERDRYRALCKIKDKILEVM